LRQVPAGTVAELDLGALQHFDSSALALVLALLRSAQQAGVELRLHAVPPRLRDLTVVYGVGDLLP
jgi:phospholipid transport system transporter-binding protein